MTKGEYGNQLGGIHSDYAALTLVQSRASQISNAGSSLPPQPNRCKNAGSTHTVSISHCELRNNGECGIHLGDFHFCVPMNTNSDHKGRGGECGEQAWENPLLCQYNEP